VFEVFTYPRNFRDNGYHMMYHAELISKGCMPRKANFIFAVQIRISEAFTLDSIVRSPRTFKPKDVLSACQNNDLVVTHGDPPPEVISLATYVMTDFFAMAHATGLYNRQLPLWEALSKVNSIHVTQLSSGVFRKEPIQVFDFDFQDYKGKTLLLANLVTRVPDKKTALDMLKGFISRASGKAGTGALACFSAPMPASVLDYVQKQIPTDDPIGRYESIMPGVNRSFDLFEMDRANLIADSQDASAEGSPEMRTIFQLKHPDLRKKSAGSPPAKAKRPKKKQSVEMESESISEPESNSLDEAMAGTPESANDFSNQQ
jgi:hypothetical protein